MAMLLFGLGKGIYRHVQESNNPASRSSPHEQDTIQYTPSPYNPQYGAPNRQNSTLAQQDEPPPPYTREAAPEFQLPQPQTLPESQPQSQPPTRAQPQRQRQEHIPQSLPQIQSRTQLLRQPQSRQEQISQPQPQPQPPRSQSQRQPQPPTRAPSEAQRSTIPEEYSIPPPYQHPPQHIPSQQQSQYVVVDAGTAGVGACDCIYRDGFGLAPKCRNCVRQERRGTQTGERRRRRERNGPIRAIIAEVRR